MDCCKAKFLLSRGFEITDVISLKMLLLEFAIFKEIALAISKSVWHFFWRDVIIGLDPIISARFALCLPGQGINKRICSWLTPFTDDWLWSEIFVVTRIRDYWRNLFKNAFVGICHNFKIRVIFFLKGCHYRAGPDNLSWICIMSTRSRN